MQTSTRETATVLAALRAWQERTQDMTYAEASALYPDIFGEETPLIEDDIDALCETLNMDSTSASVPVSINSVNPKGEPITAHALTLSAAQVSAVIDQSAQLVVSLQDLAKGIGSLERFDMVLTQLQAALVEAGAVENNTLPIMSPVSQQYQSVGRAAKGG